MIFILKMKLSSILVLQKVYYRGLSKTSIEQEWDSLSVNQIGKDKYSGDKLTSELFHFAKPSSWRHDTNIPEVVFKPENVANMNCAIRVTLTEEQSTLEKRQKKNQWKI